MRTVQDLEDRWDAIVIGAGPAGCVAAMELVRLGWRTLLLDRSTGPRPKCCGHCLNPRLAPLLARLGLLELVERVSLGPTCGVRIRLESDSICETKFQERAGWITPRDRLDEALRHEAERRGASVARGAHATVMVHPLSRPRVQIRMASQARTVQASLVVGADGLRSGVARAADLMIPPRPRAAYGFSFTIEHSHAPASDEGWIDMHINRFGYCGVVRAGDLTHIGALVRRSKNGDAITPRQFLAKTPLQFGGGVANASDLLDNAIVRGASPLPARVRTVATNRIALVGDAAGYVEPFTGEGMSWAFESAAALGATLEGRPVGEFSRQTAARYARAWRSVIQPGHRRCAVIASLVGHPGVIRASRVAGPMTRRWHDSVTQRVVGGGAAA